MPVTIDHDPSEAIRSALSKGIAGFNRHTIPDLEPNEAEIRFHAIATDENGNLIGGLRGTCYWNTLHIELLWLADRARGTSVGRQMIENAEAFAVQNGDRGWTRNHAILSGRQSLLHH